MYICLHVKYPLLPDFKDTFHRTLKYQISWRYFPWKPRCCMRTGRWTVRHDEDNRLSQLCELA